MNELQKTIGAIGVVPVIKLTNPERDAAPLADALCRGGLPVAEITFRAAGAHFVVTPGFDPEIVAYCVKIGMPIFPGCTTPTDYHAAYKFGLEVLKFFPAEQSGGLAKIKAMSAPFPMFKVMPTGGISLKNLKEYISCPVICACGGSYMVTAELIEGGKWDEITALCEQSVAIVKEARSNG